MESIYEFGENYNSSCIRKIIDKKIYSLRSIDTTTCAEDINERVFFTQQQLDEIFEKLEKFIFDSLYSKGSCSDSDIMKNYINIQQNMYEEGNFAFVANKLSDNSTINDVKIEKFSKNFENGDVNDIPIIKKIIDKKIYSLRSIDTTTCAEDINERVFFTQQQLDEIFEKLEKFIFDSLYSKGSCSDSDIMKNYINIQQNMYEEGNFAFVANKLSDNSTINDVKIEKFSKNFENGDVNDIPIIKKIIDKKLDFLNGTNTTYASIDPKNDDIVYFSQSQLCDVDNKLKEYINEKFHNKELCSGDEITEKKTKILQDEYQNDNFAFILPEKIKGKPSGNKVVVNVELSEVIAIIRREYGKDFERLCYNVNSFLKIDNENDERHFSNSDRGGRRSKSIEGSILLNLVQNTYQYHNSNMLLGVTEENVEDELNNLRKTSPDQKIAIIPFKIEPNSSDYPDAHEVVLVVDMDLWNKGDHSNSVMVYDSSYASLKEKYNESFAYGKKIINQKIVQKDEDTCSFWAEAFALTLDSRVTRCRIGNLPCIKQIVNEETFMKEVEDRKNSIVGSFNRGEKLKKTNKKLGQELYLYENVAKRFVGGEEKIIDISSYGNCQ